MRHVERQETALDARDNLGNSASFDRSIFWADLSGSRTLEEFAPSWLAFQASLTNNAVQGVVILKDQAGGSFVPVAQWPETGAHVPERLADVAERSLTEQAGLLTELSPQAAAGNGDATHRKTGCWGIAYPLIIDTQLHGVVAFEVEAARQEALRPAMEQLQWGMLSFELLFRRVQAKEGEAVLSRLRTSVDVVASVLAEDDYNEACMTFATDMATLMQCDKVSLGLTRGGSIHVQAISHSANFDKRMNFIHALSTAMDEAILQRQEISYPQPPGGVLVTRSHEDYSRRFGAQSLLTIPLYDRDCYFGALTLERNESRPFSAEEAEVCKTVFALVAPILKGKKVQAYSLVRHVWEAGRKTVHRLIGPGHIEWKLTALLICAVAVFFTFATGEHEVTAQTTLEGMVKRTIAAPFRGYIKEAFSRSGDTVRKGKILCELDSRDLRLEKTELTGQQNEILLRQQKAIADNDWAKANVIKAQLDQVKAQIQLTDLELDRSIIRAPFDGILVRGDLSQKIGAAVKQGETLFQISPLSAYRLVLMVDESDITYVRPGERGQLLLSALSEKFPFVVTKITPVTMPVEGANCFRVEARLESDSGNLRPGMQGISKIRVGRGKLISLWTISLRNWLRLKLWAWLP